MKLTSYQQHLLSDEERLSALYEAITKKTKGIVYDLGAGSGILSSWAAPLARHVYAVEKDPYTAKLAENNLKSIKNVSLLVNDARNIIFPEYADLIICEMMDTALIEEDQAPVLNSVRKYLKEDGDIIPCGVFNGVELVDLSIGYPLYLEGKIPQYKLLSKLIIYDKIDFKQHIPEKVEYQIRIPLTAAGIISSIKITTFTLFTSKIICGPTPMMNPPLLAPTNHLKVNEGETIILNLEYSMGGGLDSLRASVETVS
ncbi:MAG: methyltransferase domain-containing protein [Methanobacteriaceae archaeon]|nr:methyltransferase domain-containing protein [Methanobacteriaceae archaeon]